MTEFPDLHRAFPRPSAGDMDKALQHVTTSLPVAAAWQRWRVFKVAAAIAGLAAAYGVGYLTGSRHTATSSPPDSETQAKLIIRPPELVAGPRR
jgi:hypothetical protein